MKTLTIIATILLISYINTGSVDDDDIATCGGVANSLKDCKDLDLDPGDEYCCYMVYKQSGQTIQKCYALTKEDYDQQDEFKETLKTKYEMTVTKLQCNSNYLKIYFLSLFLTLLL
jgi:hypothetical protein